MADFDVSDSESSTDIDTGDGGFEEDLDDEAAGDLMDLAWENYSSDDDDDFLGFQNDWVLDKEDLKCRNGRACILNGGSVDDHPVKLLRYSLLHLGST